jgi:hypothetical protein
MWRRVRVVIFDARARLPCFVCAEVRYARSADETYIQLSHSLGPGRSMGRGHLSYQCQWGSKKSQLASNSESLYSKERCSSVILQII